MLKRALTAGALALAALSANAQTVLLSETFEDVSKLQGQGWSFLNLSKNPYLPWSQGNAGQFTGQGTDPSSVDTSYIAASYNSSTQGGFLNFLLTPSFSTAVAGTVTFYAKSMGPADGYTDLLGWGLVTSGGIPLPLDLGLLTTHAIGGDWTEYTWNFSSLGAGSTARFAIEYVGSNEKSDYVGVDTLTVTAVPEPSTWAMLGLGLAAVGFIARRRAPQL